MQKTVRILALLLAAWVAAPTLAERQRPLAQVPAENADAARVIVAYRAGAALARLHPVRTGESRSVVATAYQRRADDMGQRAGVALRAGRAVGDRAHVVTASGIGSKALAARLAQDPDVAYAVVDRRFHVLAAVNDPLFAAGPASGRGPDVGQWYLHAPTDLLRSSANVEGAWAAGSTGSGIVVAVVDTGAWYGHVDLQGRLLDGYDFISDTPTANDGNGRDSSAADPGDWCASSDSSSWHGTQMAGIIGALTNNGIGMAGIAHGARVLPVRALGKCGGYESDIAAGMLWAAGIAQAGLAGSSTPARVLNLSLGGDSGEACSTLYQEAVNAVVAKGAVVVVAAGNSAGHAVGAPANCTGVIAVAGLRHAGSKVGFSDLGPEITIAAPGGNCVNTGAGEPCLYPILSTVNSGPKQPVAGGSAYTDGIDFAVGTSFSTPIVAGTVALMLSARPQLTPVEIKQALQSSARAFPTSGADNGPDDPTPVTTCQASTGADQLQCYCTTGLCGAGMLDAAAALNAVTSGLFARIESSPAAPAAGSALTFSAAGTLLGPGRSVATYAWTLVDGGGIAAGFSGASNAATATLQPTAAGTVLVRLVVVDDLGAQSSADASVTVAAAPVVVPPSSGGGGGGGGGAFSLAWIVLLALASLALLRRRQRPSGDNR